jgi:hypothetical protein
MVNAALPPLPVPAHVKLRAGDQPFWDGVLNARARDEWTDSDLVVGVQLARCQHDIERAQKQVDAEGTVVGNGQGAMRVNPRVNVLELLHKRERALLVALRMGGAIPAVDMNERRGVESAAKRARKEAKSQAGEEALLA